MSDEVMYDAAKVGALIAEHDAEVAAQEMLVDRLQDLLDDEEHELRRRVDRVADMRAAWAKRGVVIP